MADHQGSATAAEPHAIGPEPVTVEIDLALTEAAWAKYEDRARALDPSEVSAARLDVTQAAAIAQAGAANLLGQREALDAAFRTVPWEVIERVPEVALAAQHADLLHRVAVDETAPFADILARVNTLRGLLLDDLSAQVHRGRMPEKLLADIRAGDNSMRDKANDLNDLAVAYRTAWETLSGRTTVEVDEIEEASTLATTILARIGSGHVASAAKEGELSTGALRRRAFTLLAEDYDIVRQHGAFLFWNMPGGWEQYVPSLWSGRGTTGGAAPAAEPVPAPEPAEDMT